MNKTSSPSKMSKVSKVALAVSASLLCLSSAAFADDKDRILALEDRLDALEVELIEAKDSASKADRVKFSKSSPSPEFISSDGRSTMEFKARIQMDYVSGNEMYTGKNLNYSESFNDVSLRRIRFGLEGYFSNVWEYALEFDFDSVSDVEIKDANITYKGWDNSQLTLGFQKIAFGMEATGSSAQLAFLERASTDTFSPERAIGAQWRYVGSNYNVMLGYGLNAGVIEDDDDPSFEQDILNARVTFAPINNSEHLLHLGTSALNIKNNDNIQGARYRARPSTSASGRIIDTDDFDAESLKHYGLEFAYQHRNFLLQSEYVMAKADQVDDPEISINAYYVQAVYTLTGESWQYNGKKGTFNTVKPGNAVSAGGYGAWELAFRIDQADFDDASADIYGGKKTDYVLGLNWYLEDNLKAQFNYVHTTVDYEESYEDNDGNDMFDQDANIFQARLQLSF
ncbi:MAG: porin [Colwellia sp.]